MTLPHSLRALAIAMLLGACAEDDASRHVYSSPPPKPPRPGASAPAPASVAEVRGPSARIDAVRVTTTGAPALLTDIVEPIDLIVVVRRDDSTPSDVPLRIELALDGPADSTIIAPLDPPVSVVTARSIHVPIAPDSGGIPDGRYWTQVRLATTSGRVLATSVPLLLVVRARR